jgi:predicted nucleic acid-binding protein
LRYLVAIEQQHLLGHLFETVFVPAAVHQELTEARAPVNVRLGVSSLPGWYEVRTVQETCDAAFPVALHRGEREAILRAETLHPDVMLIDEQVGRTIALARNLPVSGTLGILERADAIGLIPDFPSILRQLKTNGFYIAESLEQQLLRLHRTRHERK